MAPFPDLKNLSFIAGGNIPQTNLRKKKQTSKRVFIHPTQTFPYKIPKRIDVMSQPRYYFDEKEVLRPVTQFGGVKISALRGQPTQRVLEVAMPQVRHIVATKNQYRHILNRERIEKLEQLLQASKATCYTKFCKNIIEQQNPKKPNSKRTESAWRKHLEYLNEMSKPRLPPKEEPVSRGQSVPLAAILPRLTELAQPIPTKTYRRLSQEEWYQPPSKVPESALNYVITPRTQKLAAPKVYREPTIQQLLNIK